MWILEPEYVTNRDWYFEPLYNADGTVDLMIVRDDQEDNAAPSKVISPNASLVIHS